MSEFLVPFSQSCVQEPLAPVTLLPAAAFCPLSRREMPSGSQHPDHPYQPHTAPAGKGEAAAGRDSEQKDDASSRGVSGNLAAQI